MAPDRNKNKILAAAGILIIGVLVVFGIFMSGDKNTRTIKDALPQKHIIPETKADNQEAVVGGKIVVPPTIDYKDLKKDTPLDELMVTRKTSLGIKESLDMIVHSDEQFIVGGQKVSMRDILEKAFTKRGNVYEENLDESGRQGPGKIKEYGVYVVQPGDNIWNIHFNILKEYYMSKNIDVSSRADEPKNGGLSSGVGKILKFSETMVIIYNLIDKQVAADINLLQPLSKIVVYNMSEVFALLQEINYDNVERIQFDGKNIWIPVKQNN